MQSQLAESERSRLKLAAQHWKKRPKQLRKLQVPRLPDHLISGYALRLRRDVQHYKAEILRAIRPLLEQHLDARQDADVPLYESTIQRLRRTLKPTMNQKGVARLFDQVSEDNGKGFNQQFNPVTGHIPVWRGTSEADRVILNAAVKDNIGLIKSIPADLLDDVEDVLRDGLSKGKRVGELQDALQERFDITERRANLIARDQVLKLNSQLVEQRSSEMGIQGYVWSTSHDSRVRPMHRDLDGTKQRFDDPPESEEDGSHYNPGQAINCRCQALPDVDDYLTSLGV